MTADIELKRRLYGLARIAGPRECWIWQGSRQPNDGYGEFRVNRRTKLAHRVSYSLHKGEIPKGLLVRHSCDNKGCVNPAHLLIGTHKDNMADMVLRKRHIAGRLAVAAKLRARTHCKHGHEYAEVGFYIYPRGRVCKRCTSLRMRLQYLNRINRIAA